MTRTIKLTIEYDGTDFNGWQIQPEGFRTVQGEIENALTGILKRAVRLYGSGRTDSGVHASGQAAHFKTTSEISCDAFCRALNTVLPADVVVRKAEDVPEDFHAQFSAKRKRYCYTILNRREPCALNRRFCAHIPYMLNVPAMKAAAQSLTGIHDFLSFTASDPGRRLDRGARGTVRQIYRSELKKKGEYLLYEIEADGFLYKMVRNITGTLIAVGSGQLQAGCIQDILTAKDRNQAGDTAPPQGLCLIEVLY